MRLLSPASLSLVALTAASITSTASATILTFSMGLTNNSNIPQSYGDRVAPVDQGGLPQAPGYSYGGADKPTPHVNVEYYGNLRLSDDVNYRYGDLDKVAFRPIDGSGGTMEIVLTSYDPNYWVKLNSFDLAARLSFLTNPPTQEDLPVKAIRILDGPGNILWQKLHPVDAGDGASNPILNPGTVIPGSLPLRHNDYQFILTAITAQTIRIQIDLTQIANKIDRFGVDNIDFEEFFNIPAPGATALLAGAGLFAARRRRHA